MRDTKIILIGLLCALGGCATDKPIEQKKTPLSLYIKEQDTAPLPWVHVISSESALAETQVDPNRMAEKIKYNLSIFPDKKRFKKVRFISMDYGIEQEVIEETPKVETRKPASPKLSAKSSSLQKEIEKIAAKGKPTPPSEEHASEKKKASAASLPHFEPLSEPVHKPSEQVHKEKEKIENNYYVNLKFYDKDPRLGVKHLFKGSIHLPYSNLPPYEAYSLMINQLMDDLAVTPLCDVSVTLD